MFDEKKAAHMAAYLLLKGGGQMSHLKLMKLLYLAERESLRKYASPMCGDYMVSMQHGPVLSTTLNLINGYTESRSGMWEDLISDRDNHEVALSRNLGEEKLGELSPADEEILDSVWQQFGAMKPFELRDHTHEKCTEWEDPHGSSWPIPLERVLRAVGYEGKQVAAVVARIENERAIARVFINQ